MQAQKNSPLSVGAGLPGEDESEEVPMGYGGLPADRLIPQLRLAVCDRVEATSLRTVAREIGMSPSGLKKFMDGNAPYTKTLHRLRSWYLQVTAREPTTISQEDATAALTVLLHDLPPHVRPAIAESMLRCVGDGYARSNRPLPGWMDDLRERYGTASGD